MSPLKADKKALSFVPQIKQAHAALAEAEAKGFQQSYRSSSNSACC
jgi:hypothetical protein